MKTVMSGKRTLISRRRSEPIVNKKSGDGVCIVCVRVRIFQINRKIWNWQDCGIQIEAIYNCRRDVCDISKCLSIHRNTDSSLDVGIIPVKNVGICAGSKGSELPLTLDTDFLIDET